MWGKQLTTYIRDFRDIKLRLTENVERVFKFCLRFPLQPNILVLKPKKLKKITNIPTIS